ncbi:MAG TPA: hypothetical protein VFC48_09535 [Cellulomonas sp.]|nr:hypothetical protein [Cellulomonas sp.]
MNPFVQLLVVVLMLVVSVAGGWVLTSTVLRLAGRSPDAGSPEVSSLEDTPDDDADTVLADEESPRRPARATVSDGPDGARARAVLRGGTWIGILERVAVTGCVLAGDMTSVALVVAVKGLGRYPELRENPGASERFVIGTLTSMIWAALVGVAGRPFLA